MENLLKKYDIQGPRYTSFPPVPFWKGAPAFNQWINDLQRSYNPDLGLDLYLHIPYCYSICHYCGCNRQLAEDNRDESSFVDLLLKEWQQYIVALGFVPKVRSLHFGGGTPTYLSPNSFRRILDSLLANKNPQFIGSVEIHPHITTEAHLELFKEYGIQRLSIGVQDLNDQVLEACNRKTNVKQIIDFYKLCRSLAFESINFDLIYGLPHQTVESMNHTFKQVIDLRPDLLAFFSFAYVPWKMDNQAKIDQATIPSPELKSMLFQLGKQALVNSGYSLVGLDHFALPESYLGKALKQKKLKRNFMGHVDQKSDITLGLGPSAISSTPFSFAQNQRGVHDYQQSLERIQPRFVSGHQLSEADRRAQVLIHDIMCNGQASFAKSEWQDFAFSASLQEMIDDQLIEWREDAQQYHLTLTELGRPFVRNVAMKFDHYLKDQQDLKIFSKTV